MLIVELMRGMIWMNSSGNVKSIYFFVVSINSWETLFSNSDMDLEF